MYRFKWTFFKKDQNYFLAFFSLLILLSYLACNTPVANVVHPDPRKIPAISEEGINAVIEIPAGTNDKIEYDKTTNRFLQDQENGKDRVIQFLPYPANYGFIPSTFMDKNRGGDGDPLDILVIAPYQRTGSVMQVRLIGALQLLDDGELDTKIIAIPVDSAKQVISVMDYPDLAVRYQPVLRIIETWLLNYKGPGRTELIGWQDELFARREVEKWQVYN